MRVIPLSKGKVTYVDDEDFEWLSQWKWHAVKAPKKSDLWYVQRSDYKNPKRSAVLMHREILKADKKEIIDHKNGDGLMNIRSNLRKCTRSENMWNTRKKMLNVSSKYKGVSWCKEKGKFCAFIRKFGKNRNLGSFSNEELAAKAYDAAAKALFGEFAVLNFS